MADTKLTDLVSTAQPVAGDYLYVVDTSDTTDGSAGTSKKALVGSLLDVFNVKHYGAVGDDSTDDTSAITTALSALSTAGGGTLYFPAGTYRTSAPILGVENSVICGDGWSSIIKPLSGFTATDYADATIGANNGVIGLFAGGSLGTYSNLTIRDLAIDGQDYVAASNVNGVMFSYATGCLVERVKVSGIEDYGIWCRHGSDYTVRDCYVIGGSESIEASQTVDNVKIIGNHIEGIDQETANQILIYGDATNVIISDNTGEDYGTGINISASSGGCRWVTLSNNSFSVKDWTTGAVKYGLDIDDNDFADSVNVSVVGGRYESEQSAIIIRNTNAACRDVAISGCTLIATSDASNGHAVIMSSGTYERISITGTVSDSHLGFNLESTDNGVLANNAVKIRSTGPAAVFGSDIMNEVSITGNTVSSGYIQVGSNCSVVGNNYLGEGTARPITVTGTNNLISSNRLQGGVGVDVNGDDNYIHGNMFDSGGAVDVTGTTGNVQTANEAI